VLFIGLIDSLGKSAGDQLKQLIGFVIGILELLLGVMHFE
jgi:hypothetical protein